MQARIAVFASGSGTNAEQIFGYFRNHGSISVGLLLSNKPDAYALVRAEKAGIASMVFTRDEFASGIVLEKLISAGITHLVLAGFLWLMPEATVRHYAGRIINIHPALLPAFGGKGMYGMRVHEAVKASGATTTGITIHEVNERYDEGRIIFQASCPVDPQDTPERIAEKVHALEYGHYPSTIDRWITSTYNEK
ncbi:MAG: phosphoribosylglycinamide formyltransferase [Bacteroidota bacterium]